MLMSSLEAARKRGVSKRWINKLCEQGKIKAQLVGQQYVIESDDLDAYIKEQVRILKKRKEERITKKFVMSKLQRVGPLSEDQQAQLVCVMVGHSRILEEVKNGELSCARCGAFLGTILSGVVDLTDKVIIGKDNDMCRAAAKTLKWQDTLLTKEWRKS